MPIPHTISNDQIIIWEQEISQDPLLGSMALQHPIFKEILLAGKYLTEELIKLQCPEELIGRITFTAGQLSFGRDPWEIVEDLIIRYQQNTLLFEED